VTFSERREGPLLPLSWRRGVMEATLDHGEKDSVPSIGRDAREPRHEILTSSRPNHFPADTARIKLHSVTCQRPWEKATTTNENDDGDFVTTTTTATH
jgi:hypothetical protein